MVKINKKGEWLWWGIFIFTLVCIGFLLILFSIIGLHIKITDEGKHTGYVTAVETNGLIFKTHSAYFKSELESSQEDRYCVIDSDLRNELIEASKDRKRITIYYIDYLFAGWDYCKMDDIAIIVDVESTELKSIIA